VLAYQVFGQAADLLPLLFAVTVAIGVLGSKLFPAGGHWIRQVAACLTMLGAATLFIRNAPAMPLNSTGIDATEYLEKLDMATFPGPAVLCANWTKSVPIRYAYCVLTPRSDLRVVTTEPDFWKNVAQRVVDRPVYATDALNSGGVCAVEPFRNVFLLKCPKISADATPTP
jgi:hypothetical protein